MARNMVQFQKGMSELDFVDLYVFRLTQPRNQESFS
jgi:hypothetical protein